MDDHRDFIEGFRITRETNCVIIEATDYHARPLRLSAGDLAELGLRFTRRDPGRTRLTRQKAKSEHDD